MPAHDEPVTPAAAPVHGKSAFHVGDPLPLVLTARELGAILGYSGPRTSELKKAGAFDLFEILPRIGLTPRYSGKKVEQWLNGELEMTRGRNYFGRRAR